MATKTTRTSYTPAKAPTPEEVKTALAKKPVEEFALAALLGCGLPELRKVLGELQSAGAVHCEQRKSDGSLLGDTYWDLSF